MLRAAAVGRIICQNLKRVEIDKDLVIKALLLHDMGNIIKFDFADTDMLQKKDKKRVNELIKTQKQFIKKYGNKTDEVTLQIIKEMTFDKRIIKLCANSHWEEAEEIIENDYWNRKIVCYSDMRVGPFGIMNLHDRFIDLIKRRPKKKKALKWLYKRGVELESQIQKQTEIDLNKISNSQIEKKFVSLRKVLI
jgi:hypothetical protein